MAGYEQFGELPEQVKPQADAAPAGAPRLRQPRREQIELRAVDIDSLIGKDHPVRVIWAYGSSVDTSKSRDTLHRRSQVDEKYNIPCLSG